MDDQTADRSGQWKRPGWLGQVLMVFGALFLSREAVKLFRAGDQPRTPGGSGAAQPPDPTPLADVTVGWDAGLLSHDLLVTNGSPQGRLDDVGLTVTLYREDGLRIEQYWSWSSWGANETRRLTVPAHPYRRVRLRGAARAGPVGVRIDTEWHAAEPGSGVPPRPSPAKAVEPGLAPAATPPRSAAGLTARLVPGLGSSVLELTNGFDGGILRNVRLTLTGTRSDGAPVERTVTWDEWGHGVALSVELPAHPYTRIDIRGTATSGKEGWENLTITEEWAVRR